MRRDIGLLIGLIGAAAGFWLNSGVPEVSAHGGDSTKIHACINQRSGEIKIVSAAGTCRPNQVPLDWNINGPAGPQGPPGPPFPAACPPDSVLTGTTCVDKYETSVWETTDATVIEKIKNGTVTLADLTVAGAIQRGAGIADYNPGCPYDGDSCVNLYAVSIPGVIPSRFINWFQAVATARNSGKRLPTNQEWQAAALGTPDPGTDNGISDCSVAAASGVVLTGSRANCVSNVGAFDMVGNLWEWVADWVPASTTCVGQMSNDDLNCLAGASITTGPGALVRGGAYSFGQEAGVFAVDGALNPTASGQLFGFRTAR